MKTLVSNHFELANLLAQKFGNRLEIDAVALLDGVIQGMLDSKEFCIDFIGDEYLNICTGTESREILDEFLPILKRVMGGLEPLCTYDFLPMGMEAKDAMPTIEWDLQYPKDRMEDVITGDAFNPGDRVYNLNFYNSKKILVKTAYRYNSSDKLN